MKESQNSVNSTQQHSEQGSGSSLNDYTGSYITVLTGRGGGIAMAVRGAGDELNADTLTDRTAMITREAEGDVTMRAVLPQLIDTAAFNLAFLAVTEIITASQRCLLTKKHQNKLSTVLQE
ncbi:hypothetical protein BDDG_12640 [Blastomyces dermatitidis ATCC 18188]|uniref:Uncharacterized protein n=1 Tax=Ajellomyces dermatitidis (strain ATCC 18188 / CBS 674.68) TaxID=653446 RepID=A0A0J9EPJ0_AJEDA|nr:hypothetical protein BDDG_12640 [Blastomyces dermatitidis ATCC 18188]